jgi:hypothetical protein
MTNGFLSWLWKSTVLRDWTSPVSFSISAESRLFCLRVMSWHAPVYNWTEKGNLPIWRSIVAAVMREPFEIVMCGRSCAISSHILMSRLDQLTHDARAGRAGRIGGVFVVSHVGSFLYSHRQSPPVSIFTRDRDASGCWRMKRSMWLVASAQRSRLRSSSTRLPGLFARLQRKHPLHR